MKCFRSLGGISSNHTTPRVSKGFLEARNELLTSSRIFFLVAVNFNKEEDEGRPRKTEGDVGAVNIKEMENSV